MEVLQVPNMKGGNGDTSYANNSLIQRKIVSIRKSVRDETMLDLLSTSSIHKSLSIANLGCSSGPNTFMVVSDLMDIVHSKYSSLGYQTTEYLVYLNDLLGNDFKSVFTSLQGFHGNLKESIGDKFGQCFIFEVPRSFYGRLFPSKSLHFVHSSCSVHWLSLVQIVVLRLSLNMKVFNVSYL
ncbi:hypothetical protein GIB67_006519 [Kingdonia uniflora]|uniref:Uncharacterized protein n=1 Tax=Kingdonia uniflora TaxID=39325 RepID=A0A7J7LEY9_9MAGN|nr:hypothetical protein GIB67_006519 [Kingdonia uniflora]